MTTAIEVANLYKKFGRVIALENVNLKVNEGEVVGILGPNGSGKSTLLRILVGILKPTRGYISLWGVRPSKDVRRFTAYISENDIFYRWMRVEELVKFVASFYEDFDTQKAKELLEVEGIEGWKKVGELSKGMRQRLKLILAISRSPKLILLDEPFSGIDMVSRARITEMLKAFLIEKGSTALISTHFMDGIEEILERAVFIQNGRLVFDENCERLRLEEGKSLGAKYFEVFGGEYNG